MMELIGRLRTDLGLTVLLIEHDMRVVMGISDRITVLDHGERIAEGTPDEVRARPEGHRGLPRGTGRMSATVRRQARLDGDAGRCPARARRRPHLLRPDPRPAGRRRSRSARGEIVTLIGANGAGKTTTLKTICGLLHPRQGTVTFEGKDISRPPAHELVRARHRPCARGTPDLLAADRPREPPDGRLHPRRAAELADDLERVFDALPAAAGARPPERRHAVGRRAADARHRARADGRAASAAARRAVARALADPRPADLRDHPRDQRAGHDDPARRAERAPGARRRRIAATCSRPGACPVRTRPRRSPRTRTSAGPTSGRSEPPPAPDGSAMDRAPRRGRSSGRPSRVSAGPCRS